VRGLFHMLGIGWRKNLGEGRGTWRKEAHLDLPQPNDDRNYLAYKSRCHALITMVKLLVYKVALFAQSVVASSK